MPKDFEKTSVEGGVITREARSGRLVSVETSKGVSRGSKKTEQTIAQISEKHRDALKRLADR